LMIEARLGRLVSAGRQRGLAGRSELSGGSGRVGGPRLAGRLGLSGRPVWVGGLSGGSGRGRRPAISRRVGVGRRPEVAGRSRLPGELGWIGGLRSPAGRDFMVSWGGLAASGRPAGRGCPVRRGRWAGCSTGTGGLVGGWFGVVCPVGTASVLGRRVRVGRGLGAGGSAGVGRSGILFGAGRVVDRRGVGGGMLGGDDSRARSGQGLPVGPAGWGSPQRARIWRRRSAWRWARPQAR
jgi:hypothetical protein